MATLREALFADARTFFAPNRLSLAFTSGQQTYEPIRIDGWTLTPTTASTSVLWVAPTSTNVDGVKLIDGTDVVEWFPFLDDLGEPDYIRVLIGMELDYSFFISLEDA